MRVMVGAGRTGLSSIPYVNGRVIRPLLDCTRDELRTYLANGEDAKRAQKHMQALWREDVTNADTNYERAFVRHNVIPLLEQRNPDLLHTLGRTIDILSDEDVYMENQANMLMRRIGGAALGRGGTAAQTAESRTAKGRAAGPRASGARAKGARVPGARQSDVIRDDDKGYTGAAGSNGNVAVALNARLLDSPRPLARRMVYNACNRAIAELAPYARITFDHIEAIIDNGVQPGFAIHLPGGIEVRNVHGTLTFAKAAPPRD
jgi:hypothetical protein